MPISRTAIFSSLLLTALMVPSTVLPAQAEDGTRWRMTVTAGKLKPISIADRLRKGVSKTYWYTILKVENKTGKTRDLTLAAKGLTPQLKKNPVTNPGFFPSVTKAIAKQEREKNLINLFEANGKIEDGSSKTIVVIFGDLSPLTNTLDLRIKGLANTLYKEGAKVYFEDTELSIRFQRVGDQFDVTREKVYTKGKRWVTVKTQKIR